MIAPPFLTRWAANTFVAPLVQADDVVLVNEDGYEDDVVYSEHDLQGQKREESDPDLGIQQQVHASHSTFLSPNRHLRLRPSQPQRRPASLEHGGDVTVTLVAI
jgi:hypothetical protein